MLLGVPDYVIYGLAGGTLLVAIVLGLLKKAIIFDDAGDAFITLAAPAIVIIGTVVMFLIRPDEVPESFNPLWDGHWRKAISITGLAIAAACLVVSLVTTIRHSGLFMGTFLYICKVALATLGVLLGVVMLFGKLLIIRVESARRDGTIEVSALESLLYFVAMVTLIGLLATVAKKLVNGKAVRGLA